MLVDIAANGVAHEEVIKLRLNAVVEVTTDGLPVDVCGLSVVTLRHLVRLVFLDDRFLEVAILSKLTIT